VWARIADPGLTGRSESYRRNALIAAFGGALEYAHRVIPSGLVDASA
jgi:hypothetical protein